MGALNKLTTGLQNAALGTGSLQENTTGNYNTAAGINALRDNISEDNTTRLRNVFQSFASGRAVYGDSANKIGTLRSSCRYKEDEPSKFRKSAPGCSSLNPRRRPS